MTGTPKGHIEEAMESREIWKGKRVQTCVNTAGINWEDLVRWL